MHRTQNNVALDLVMTDTDELITGLEGSDCLGLVSTTWFCLFWVKKAILAHLYVMLQRVNFFKAERNCLGGIIYEKM